MINQTDIFKRYNHEINVIDNILHDLEERRIYEIDRVPGVPMCSTMSNNLKEKIYELLNKINNNEPGFSEQVAKYIK
jgi:quinolinate synthase